jgi:hypothetical protein
VGRLQSLIDSRGSTVDIARMRFELAGIIDAVKSTVPQQMSAKIVEKVEQHPESLDVDVGALDADDAYDPTEFSKESEF